jgi:AcrR family transcriptional regulator
VSQNTNIMMAPMMSTGAIMAGARRVRVCCRWCGGCSSGVVVVQKSALNLSAGIRTMQASTCMQPLPQGVRRRPPARQLLLKAAARVFARDGLEGATTRAISREAGVNEVTLFRNFGTKEHLLEAVVGSKFGRTAKAEPVALAKRPLAEDLGSFALKYETLLVANLPLVRAVIGEIHRHALCQHDALKGIFWPMRKALVERIAEASRDGEVRKGVRPSVAADLFAGTIFAAVMRRTSLRKTQDYSAAEYRASSIDVFLRGIRA